ncbi:MAG: hypothetical protein HGA65_01520 [Oscillochloris sp.]|nr:hypothetical protein [Oscillochloris sp.]
MVARLRHLREQREQRTPPPRTPRTPDGQAESEPPRFMPGDTIFCMPWGNGQVRSSRLTGRRELLRVFFAEHGELEIDPSVSVVRLIRAAQAGLEED